MDGIGAAAPFSQRRKRSAPVEYEGDGEDSSEDLEREVPDSKATHPGSNSPVLSGEGTAPDPSEEDQQEYEEAGDETVFRLRHLKMRRIVKENHGLGLVALVFNRIKATNANVFATAGANQANIYDNENLGEHIDLMLHFENPSRDRRVTCICWAERDQETDAVLVLGGSDGSLQLVSVLEMRVYAQLESAHAGTVQDLAYHPRPRQLLSAARDRSVRLWLLGAPGRDALQLLAHFEGAPCSSLAFFPDGRSFLAGGAHGLLRRYEAPATPHSEATTTTTTQGTTLPRLHQAEVDCMRFVAASGRVVSKSTDGLVQVWLPERPDEPLLSVRVRGAVAHATRFDLSEDGRFLACGNSRGQVFIFDLLHSGRQIARLEHPRSRAPVTACAFSHDLRSVLMCASEPYIWRWDFIAPEKASSSSSSSKRSHE